jgi:hypothetical protein
VVFINRIGSTVNSILWITWFIKTNECIWLCISLLVFAHYCYYTFDLSIIFEEIFQFFFAPLRIKVFHIDIVKYLLGLIPFFFRLIGLNCKFINFFCLNCLLCAFLAFKAYKPITIRFRSLRDINLKFNTVFSSINLVNDGSC